MRAKLIILLLLGTLLVGLSTGSYLLGSKKGEYRTQLKWNQAIKDHDEAIAKLQGEYNALESIHKTESTRISDELTITKKAYTTELDSLRTQYDKRLLGSSERAGYYQRQAESGSLECRGLASHAAKLDGSLEEGRQVVGELKATLGQRESELRLLGTQILTDRKLFNGAGS